MNGMRILALVTDAFGGSGGIAAYNRSLLTALASVDGVSSVIVLPRCGRNEPGAVPSKVKQMTPQSNRWLYVLQLFKTCFKDSPFQVVFCGHLNLLYPSYAAAVLLRAPLWLQLHGIESWASRLPLTRRIISQSRIATAISRFTRKQFLSWAPLDPVRVKVLPCTCSEVFHPGPKPSFLVNRYNLTGKKVLLTTGRLSSAERYKGHDKVIEQLPDLLRKHSDLVYMIVGDGDDKNRLHALAEKLGVAEHVLFAGEVSEAELPDYYRLADFFAMPSTGEGFGIVFLEAAACGLPILAENAGGSPDALLEGKSGILVNGEEELLAGLHDLLGGRTFNPQEAARAFSFPNFQAHVEHLVDRLVERR